MDELFGEYTHKDLLFIYAYIETFSIYKAAKKADCGASTMLKKEYIRKAIAQAMKDRVDRLQISADWVLLQLIKLYEADMSEVISVNPKSGKPYYDFKKASPEFMQAIESLDIKPTEWGANIKLKIPGKLELLKIIGKHIDVNAFEERMNLSGNVTIVYDKQDAEA